MTYEEWEKLKGKVYHIVIDEVVVEPFGEVTLYVTIPELDIEAKIIEVDDD